MDRIGTAFLKVLVGGFILVELGAIALIVFRLLQGGVLPYVAAALLAAWAVGHFAVRWLDEHA